ncbi:hypothetical protein MMC25_004608 [Agyrium rufum]|nr:hypothetical protein [Agyrium rufum]
MFYDLNVPWTGNQTETQRTLAFLAELGYSTIALNHTLNSPLPQTTIHKSPIPGPSALPFPTPPKLQILTRLTLVLTTPSQTPRLGPLAPHYSLLALRPTCEKTLLFASQAPECDLISIDITIRYPFHFRPKTFAPVLNRGLKIELCYSGGVMGAAGDALVARRNAIGNATEIIRATRGRGIVISSEAKKALGVRGPADVINLGVVWGMGQERAREAVELNARDVVVQAGIKRTGWRGVIDVVYGGEKPEPSENDTGEKGKVGGKMASGKSKDKLTVLGNGKRKADEMEGKTEGPEEEKSISKREMKRRAKRAKLEAEAEAGTKDPAAVIEDASRPPDG